MCIFTLYDCFFCVSLEAASKMIGVIYMILGTGLTVLFGVPVVLAWEVWPLYRACFYAALAVTSAALVVSSCLLLIAAYSRKPPLMRPWVVTAMVTSVPLMAVSVYGMSTLPLRYTDADTAADESVVISTYFVHALLLLYFSSVVNSRRLELVRELEDRDLKQLVYPSIQLQYRDYA